MKYQGDNQNRSRSAGLTAWLTLAAVLLLQVGAGAHEAQHASADVGEVCEICVQLDSGSALDSTVSHCSPLPYTTDDNGNWTGAPLTEVAYRSPPLRAPPAFI